MRFLTEVAELFTECILLRHGAPEVVIADRGKAFTRRLMQEIMGLSHTTGCKTAAGHPQTNGLTEGLKKAIADMLWIYVDVQHKTWNTTLSRTARACKR